MTAPTESDGTMLLDLAGVSLEEAGTKIGNGDGNGVLHISPSRVLWSSPSENIVREWSYRRILLHAICREAERPHIYCQVAEGEPPQPDDDDVQVVELKFIPTSSDSLQTIWDALSSGAALNPDPGTCLALNSDAAARFSLSISVYSTISQSNSITKMKENSFLTQMRFTQLNLQRLPMVS